MLDILKYRVASLKKMFDIFISPWYIFLSKCPRGHYQKTYGEILSYTTGGFASRGSIDKGVRRLSILFLSIKEKKIIWGVGVIYALVDYQILPIMVSDSFITITNN